MKLLSNIVKGSLTLYGLIILSSITSNAQDGYKHYGEYVYYFTKYIHWPNETGDIIIATLGSSAATSEIEHLQGKKVGNRTIVIKNFKSALEITQCDVLFIPEIMSKDLIAVLEKEKRKNVLLLSDVEGGAKKGTVINFIHEGEKIKFELNLKSANEHGLKISTKLQQLTIKVG